MDYALDIYSGGSEISAHSVPPTHAMRLACPACLEPVFLVERTWGSAHFSHYPETPKSPPCPIRTHSYGIGGTRPLIDICRERVEDLFDKDIFQKEIEKTLHIIIITKAPPVERSENIRDEVRKLQNELDQLRRLINLLKLIILMQDTWLKNKRCIEVLDLPTCPAGLVKGWSVPADLIKKSTRMSLPPLNSDEHLLTVILLWKQLHLNKVENDLRFLLEVTLGYMDNTSEEGLVNIKGANDDETFALFSGCILDNALEIIANIPWTDLP